jgi:hypothetical protein
VGQVEKRMRWGGGGRPDLCTKEAESCGTRFEDVGGAI